MTLLLGKVRNTPVVLNLLHTGVYLKERLQGTPHGSRRQSVAAGQEREQRLARLRGGEGGGGVRWCGICSAQPSANWSMPQTAAPSSFKSNPTAGADLIQLGTGMTTVLEDRGGVLECTAPRLLLLSVPGRLNGSSSVTEANKRALLEVLRPQGCPVPSALSFYKDLGGRVKG